MARGGALTALTEIRKELSVALVTRPKTARTFNKLRGIIEALYRYGLHRLVSPEMLAMLIAALGLMIEPLNEGVDSQAVIDRHTWLFEKIASLGNLDVIDGSVIAKEFISHPTYTLRVIKEKIKAATEESLTIQTAFGVFAVK